MGRTHATNFGRCRKGAKRCRRPLLHVRVAEALKRSRGIKLSGQKSRDQKSGWEPAAWQSGAVDRSG